MKKSENIVCHLITVTALLILLSPSSLADNLVISGDQITTIDSDYTQVGDILIQDSGTLVVKNGATLTANGYSVTVKGKGALKIENGVLKANKLSLYDESKLDMAQNSKLELDKFVSNNHTNIIIKNSKISADSFSSTGNNIEVYSGEIISLFTSSINTQSFLVSNSTLRGSPILIESPSGISIEKSVVDGISYISCQSLSISNYSIMKGILLKINCISKISITDSTINGISSINSTDISISDSKIGGVIQIDSSIVYISKSELNSVSLINANDFSISENSRIVGDKSLVINSSSVYIIKSEISSASGRKGEWSNGYDGSDSSMSIASRSYLSISNSKISSGRGGEGSDNVWMGSGGHGGSSLLSIKSESNLSISSSEISSSSGGNGGDGEGGYKTNGGNGGYSSVSIASKSNLLISNSKINSGSGGNGGMGGYGGGRSKIDSGDGGDSSVSIKSESNLSISNSEISSGNGGEVGPQGDFDKGGVSSLSITSMSNLLISDSKISSGSGGDGDHGGDSSLSVISESDLSFFNSKISSGNGGSGDVKGRSLVSMNFQQLYATDTIFDKPFDFDNKSVVYFTNVTLPSISAKDDTIIYKYLYIFLGVTDKLGNPISNAKVDILYYLNETTYKSGTTDSNGTAKIPVLSDIITSQGDQFVGNYKVVAYYQEYTTPKKGVEMKSNQNVILNFSNLVIKPASIQRVGSSYINASPELQSLISVARDSIKDGSQILADTSEAEKLLQQAQEYIEKNEISYATEYAFHAKESAEKAKRTRIVQYVGVIIFAAVLLIILKIAKTKK